MPNTSWECSNDIPTYGYRSTDDIDGDTCFSRPLASEVVDEYTWGDDMVEVNVVGSNISQGTNDYPAGPEGVTKEWRTPDNRVNMSRESSIVYTWTSNTIYVMINGSEDGQFESLTGSTLAIMSKGTRDQKTLSVADSLNRDRDTINNSVNRETIGNEQMAIRSGEPSNGSYGNNRYTWKSSGGTDGNNTNQRMGSDVGSDDDNGEDDDSIPLVEHKQGVVDTTNFNSVGMRHNIGEQSGNARASDQHVRNLQRSHWHHGIC